MDVFLIIIFWHVNGLLAFSTNHYLKTAQSKYCWHRCFWQSHCFCNAPKHKQHIAVGVVPFDDAKYQEISILPNNQNKISCSVREYSKLADGDSKSTHLFLSCWDNAIVVANHTFCNEKLENNSMLNSQSLLKWFEYLL